MTEKYKIGDRVCLDLTPEVRKELVIKGRDQKIEGAWCCMDEYGNEWHVEEDELTPLMPQGHPDPLGETGTAGEHQRSRLAEVLGMEETEEIRIVGGGYETDWFCVDQANGTRDLPCGAIAWAINHPESIIRAPRLTGPEIAIMRAMGATWVSRDKNCDDGSIDLWREKPFFTEGMYVTQGTNLRVAVVCDSRLFPSIKPGNCVYADGGAT